ncbi:HAMP domain-containing histidine kinase [Clostridium swellfunianum]|uniref:HAMP domain-containing sensor histidine kinase n=1 Tax=Clostridium swellfunianum TaxID=1367462 RepID=UPI00202FCAA5|nr:HAMP domain-containing sensor histidine kinase [Clostridium swellfunianum]MCM0648364.1 HAMP domain-containing histidine kinase [Clostridium swellfunianum]
MKIKIPKVIKILFAPIFLLLRPFKFLLKPAFRLYDYVMARVKKSIRAELVVTFVVCLLSATVVFGIANSYYKKNNRYSRIDYSGSISEISSLSSAIVSEINRGKFSVNDSDKIMTIIQNRARVIEDAKILVLDLDGKVLYKTGNASETQIDVYSLIKNALETKNNVDSRKEYVNFAPLQFSDNKAYVVVKAVPQAHIEYYQAGGNSFLALLIACGAFIIIFMMITKNRMLYFEEIARGIIEISKGNLDYRVNKAGDDELAALADSINLMASELQNQIEAERRAERTKNELITNVSHDLRTPLTSIMGYLGLIKDDRYSSKEELMEYINIAFNKSEKLKLLIEDLFEYTKLSSEGIKLYKQPVNVNEFLEQLIEELVPLAEEKQVSIAKEFPSEKITLNLDIDKILRVFENLIVNAIKYSYSPGEIKIRITKDEKGIVISIHNNGDTIHAEELSKIFDRFYRLEKSRSSSTGGSGLGLAIAKNIVELHGGKIWAESRDNIVSFYVNFNQ